MKDRLKVVFVMMFVVAGLMLTACGSDDGDKNPEEGCTPAGKQECGTQHATCVNACNPLDADYATCVDNCDSDLCDCLTDGGCECENPTCDPACTAGFTCVGGTCVEDQPVACDPICEAGFSCVNGACVEDEPAGCDPACEDGFTCVEGACVEDQPPACDPECEAGFSCVNGACEEDAGECLPTVTTECGTDHTTCVADCDPLDPDYATCVIDCDDELCDCLTAGNCSCD